MRPTGAYYNEFDPFAAAWLRELIREGLIADGEVDTRSIHDVRPDDVRGFTQCHWFAGIGGWSYALRLAGWPDHRPVWTGSCPCQPYSEAGRQDGDHDPRNLWPVWFPLIRECRPECIFGEQVASAIRHGWLDTLSANLEAEGYAIGAHVLGAHSVTAPHIRQRLYFVADSDSARHERNRHERNRHEKVHGRGLDERQIGGVAGLRSSSRMGDRIGAGLERHAGDGDEQHQRGRLDPITAGSTATPSGLGDHWWAHVEWLACRDGKQRPAQPGIFPLAHGVPNRVGTLRGAGNAIVPQVAQAFIESYLET